MEITHIRKRNGTLQDYDQKKIEQAVKKSLIATNQADADAISAAVSNRVHEHLSEYCANTPSGEDTQCVG